jgi:hypothetical protein
MSSEPRPIDEAEDADVTRAWASTQSVQPPAHVDDAVLKFARASQPSSRARRRWRAPLALAAVLALGFGVVLQLWREPQVRAPVPADKPAVTAAPVPAPEAVADAVLAQQAEEQAERSQASESRRRDSAAREEEQRSAESSHAPAAASPPAPLPAAEPMPAPAAASPLRSDFAPQRKSAASTPPGMAVNSHEAAEWRPADFQGLPLATTTREQVRARYGEPTSTEAQRIDRYAQLPGIQGAAEFRYDEQERLSSVRLLPEPAPTIDQWFETSARFGEPPQIADSSWSCAGLAGAQRNASVWLYPSRGVWFVLDEEKRVLQVNYAAHCD